MKTTLQIEHNGKTYQGEIAKVTDTFLGIEDHGIMTSFLYTEWKGGGVGVGGYGLDEPRRDEDDKFIGRFGSAYGLDYIMRVMETVGVSKWEDIKGKNIIVLFDGNGPSWGSTSVGFAGLDNGKVLIHEEHLKEWKSV